MGSGELYFMQYYLWSFTNPFLDPAPTAYQTLLLFAKEVQNTGRPILSPFSRICASRSTRRYSRKRGTKKPHPNAKHAPLATVKQILMALIPRDKPNPGPNNAADEEVTAKL